MTARSDMRSRCFVAVTAAVLFACLCLACSKSGGADGDSSAATQLRTTDAPGVEASVGYLKVRRRDASQSGNGTGFLIASDRLVTCLHVVDGAESAEVIFPSGLSLPITGILAEDADNDLVLLAVTPAAGQPAPLALASVPARVGDSLVLYGYPDGPSQKGSSGQVISVCPTLGMPLGIIMNMDGAITHGFSGGPVLNEQRQVVGILKGGDPAQVFEGKEITHLQGTAVPERCVTALEVGTLRSLRVWTKARGAKAAASIETSRGELEVERGDWGKGLQHFREATRLDPSAYRAWAKLGNCLQQTGKNDQAVDAIDRALALKPQFPEALRLRAGYFTDEKRFREAADIYQSLLRMNPSSDRDHLLLGVTYIRLGQSDQAREQYEAVKLTNPTAAEFLLGFIQRMAAAPPSAAGSQTGARSIVEIMKEAMADTGEAKPEPSESLIKEIANYAMPSRKTVQAEAKKVLEKTGGRMVDGGNGVFYGENDFVSGVLLAMSPIVDLMPLEKFSLPSRIHMMDTMVAIPPDPESNLAKTLAHPSDECRYVYGTYVRIYAKVLYMAGEKDKAVRLWCAANQIGLEGSQKAAPPAADAGPSAPATATPSPSTSSEPAISPRGSPHGPTGPRLGWKEKGELAAQLKAAIDSGDAETINSVFTKEPSLRNWQYGKGEISPLWYAVEVGPPKSVEAVLAFDKRVNLAMHNSTYKSVLLHSVGPDGTLDTLDVDSWPVLGWAARRGDVQVIALLLNAGATDCGEGFESAFRIAMFYGRQEGARVLADGFLSQKRFKVANCRGLGGDLLEKAADLDMPDIAEGILAAAKAAKLDASAWTRGGVTPLHYASAIGSRRVMEVLLANAFDANARAKVDGSTALHCAVSGLRPGQEAPSVEDDLRADQKRTIFMALGIAEVRPAIVPTNRVTHAQAVELLLSKGADLAAKNRRGQTPLALAISLGEADCVAALRKAGATE